MQKSTTNVLDSARELRRRYAIWRGVATDAESRGYNTTDRILLTFDDYGTAKNIHGILDVLAKEQARAFFFIKGKWVLESKENAELVKEIEAQGHWVGSHSYNHVRLDQQTDETIQTELKKGLQTKIMRPPYGAYDKRVRKIAHSLGFKIAYWTIDSFDWKGISAQEIQQNVLPNLHKGACILMHLNTPHTLEALPGLIAGIKERGFELCHDGTEINV